jgi:hypothetical protein
VWSSPSIISLSPSFSGFLPCLQASIQASSSTTPFLPQDGLQAPSVISHNILSFFFT